uniref:AUGMIN subunit 8 n=1 Tax=Aegilops tauschii subsp. strangulata TaxID=200361 RepID=A0A453KWI6_AEGTS
MDVHKSTVQKAALVEETRRPPLVPSEKHNASSLSRVRDVASRYKTGQGATATRRCTSPSLGRTSTTNGTPVPNRAQSADRRRPSTPSTPSSKVSTPSTPTSRSITPVRDTVKELESAAAPGNKKDKVVSSPSLDHIKGQASVLTERKRSPLRRKKITEQCENSRPSEDLPRRATEQNRWPAMTSGRGPANLMPNTELSDKSSKPVTLSNTSRGLSPRKICASEDAGKRLNQSLDDVARRLAIHAKRRDEQLDSGSDVYSQTTERSKYVSRPSRTTTLPVPVLHRSSSPNKVLSAASSASRAFQSPSRTRPSTPCRSQSAGSIQSGVIAPVVSYMVDPRKGKKNASQIENIHQLRLLHNRYLQLRLVNARSEDVLSYQKATAENTIYNVWRNTSNLRDAVNLRRIMVQRHRQELKLYGILQEQIACLEQWPALEDENNLSFSRATEALKASTLRLPVTSGARVDAVSLKNAVSSAVDVMQGLGSSVCSMLSKYE